MKKIVCLLMLSSLSSFAGVQDQEGKIANMLVPFGQDEATWVSECKFSMKGKINIDSNKNFELVLKAYSTFNCEEGTDYITVRRTGEYEYQKEEWDTVVINEGEDNEYSYNYIVNPEQLNLTMSEISYENGDSGYGELAVKFIDMYKGCFGDETRQKANGGCKKNLDIEKTKARVRASNIEFINPRAFLGKFRRGVNLEFNLIN